MAGCLRCGIRWSSQQHRTAPHTEFRIVPPRSVQPAAKQDLREIWQAPDRATAETAIATFAEKYGAKYEKAVICLTKDRDALLTFYERLLSNFLLFVRQPPEHHARHGGVEQ